KRAKLGPHHDQTLNAMETLIGDYQNAGLWDKALSMAQQVLDRLTIHFGPHHPATLMAMCNVAQSYVRLGRSDEALALCQTALDLYRTAPESQRGSPSVLLEHYSHVCFLAGKLDDAERLERESLEYVQKQRGIRGRVNTAHVMSHLASILLKQELFAEAE